MCVMDQVETVQHILNNRVFARQFRYELLAALGLDRNVPRRNEKSFAEWWRKASRNVEKTKKKGFNSMVILGGFDPVES